MRRIHYPGLILSAIIFSCSRGPVETRSEMNQSQVPDSVVSYNQQMVTAENQEIEDYIARHHWTMQRSQTGLFYWIYKDGTGPTAGEASTVSINYSVSLLTGDLVYQTDATKKFTFETGRRHVVSGLEEGILLMNKGCRAKLIVPSHLAFGLLGDLEKVPARATLVFDIELCDFEAVKK